MIDYSLFDKIKLVRDFEFKISLCSNKDFKLTCDIPSLYHIVMWCNPDATMKIIQILCFNKNSNYNLYMLGKLSEYQAYLYIVKQKIVWVNAKQSEAKFIFTDDDLYNFSLDQFLERFKVFDLFS